MKKCAIHETQEGLHDCPRCKKQMCFECENVSGKICPDCALAETDKEYAKNKKTIKRQALERDIYLLTLILGITGLILLIFIEQLRSVWYIFVILPGLPLIPFTAPAVFRSITRMVSGTEGGITKFLLGYLLVVLYALVVLAFGILSNPAYIIWRTITISLNKSMNRLMLAQYIQETRYSPSNDDDYLFLP